MTGTSILNHFTGEPRPQQTEALQELERVWDQADVFIVRAPVGAGKSRLGHCLGLWSGDATVITPTNQLVSQYLDTWPGLPTPTRGTSRGSAAARAVVEAPLKVMNYYSYLAHRAYSPTVIVDEAHRLVPMLSEMEAVTLWQHLIPVPASIYTAGDLLVWAERYGHARTDKLATKLRQHPDTYVLERGTGEYRGHPQDYVRLVPLTPRHNRPILWPPRRVRKLVFMSATFHYEDLYDLGLEGRRIRVIESGSPIAAADRPVIYDPVGSMAADLQDRNLDALAAKLRTLMVQHHNERGVIHTTYALAAKLRELLGDHPRLRWHDSTTRDSTYRRWRREGGNAVLVACGMTEGIDLPGDLARWQAVTKLMYPDRSDPAVLAKARLRPDWYAWMAARDLQQAVGRSSRGAGDFSVVYVLDSAFRGLYSKHRDMFPAYFQEALTC